MNYKKQLVKIGLIIQGPINSIGRSGSAFDVSGNSVTDSHITEYNCVKNLKRIIENYSELFDQIILSTWDDENFYNEFEGIQTIRLSKNKVPKVNDWGGNLNKFIRKNNMFFQFYSIKEACKLINDDITHILKIRTDQYLDLKKIKYFFIQEYQENTLVIPHLWKDNGKAADFYIGAEKKIFNDFIKSMFYEDKKVPLIFHNSVHYQIVLKFGYLLYKDEIPIDLKYYTSRYIHSLEQSLLLSIINNRIIRAFPIEIYKNLEWRGHSIPKNRDYSDHIRLKPLEGFEDFNPLNWHGKRKLSYFYRRIANILKKLFIN